MKPQLKADPCWCGEKHPQYNFGALEESCGGGGYLNCFCGGDNCACHLHGGMQCEGCDDCEDGDDDYDDPTQFDDEYWTLG